MRAISITFVLVGTALLFLAPDLGAQTDRRLTPPPAQERRVALVVGNDTYAEAPLRNARNDARAVARALTELGFRVTTLEDATRPALVSAVAELGNGLQANDVALFYFAGHGVQVDGENYLIPADFRGHSATEVRFSAVKAGEVQQSLQAARVSLLVLDACRNNPFAGARGGGGLAPMETRGSLIAFATGAGQTAADGTATNGLFTQELLKTLREPGLKAQDVFQRVRQGVYAASSGKQFPAVYDGLLGDFVFRRNPPSPSTASSSDSDLAARTELALWEAIKDSASPAVFEDYVRQYPSGRFTIAARDRIARLRTPAPVTGGGGVATVPPVVKPAATSTFKLTFSQLATASLDALMTDCDAGHADACWQYGLRYDTGRGVTPDEARAAVWFQRGCEGGSLLGCVYSAIAYTYGKGVPKDEARGVELSRRACEGGNSGGCYILARAYEAGLGVPRDRQRALEFYRRGCTGRDDDQSCQAVKRLGGAQ